MNECITESKIINEKPKPIPKHIVSTREKKILTAYYDIKDVREYRRIINGWSGQELQLSNAKQLYAYLYRWTDLKIFEKPKKLRLLYYLWSFEYQTDRPIYWHGDPIMNASKDQPRYKPNY